MIKKDDGTTHFTETAQQRKTKRKESEGEVNNKTTTFHSFIIFLYGLETLLD